MTLTPEKIREDFPALQARVYGKPLVYLDNAATTHKPRVVLDAISHFYSQMNSNIHRGTHFLSVQATEAFEKARTTVANFIHARHTHEIIFTRGTTDSVNLVASSFGSAFLKSGDEILITALEHHSNLVPWQMACQKAGAHLRVIPVDENGTLILDILPELFNEKTRLMAVAHVSNALGTILPVRELIRQAHDRGIPVFLDGAQAIQHLTVDVQELDCDFYAFSGHKIYAPMGIGILYGKEEWLEKLPPYQAGGEMIRKVAFDKTTYNDLPFKFEAGTPNVEGAIGLDAALEYIRGIGLPTLSEIENKLYTQALDLLGSIDGFQLIGNAPQKCSVISFLLHPVHPYDTGAILDQFGIAVRTGHHCAQPLMDRLNLPGTVRASIAFYNTADEIEFLAESLKKVKTLFL